MLEYGTDDPTRLSVIAAQSVPACAASHLPGGTSDSVRLRELIGPNGFGDELRMVARNNGLSWGVLNLFRTEGDAPFSGEEVAAVAAISDAVAEGSVMGWWPGAPSISNRARPNRVRSFWSSTDDRACTG